MNRRGYPSDISNEEWSFVAPYLSLIKEDAPQRNHDLREVFNALRWMIRSGSLWRYLPGDFPPWEAVYQQSQRWLRAGVFEDMTGDLRSLLRLLEGRAENPTATMFDGRTLKSTPESGERAGFDGYKRTRGSKVHLAVATLGLLLTLVVTPANEQERHQVEELAQKVQTVTGQSVELAYVDQGYTGENAANAAKGEGIELFVVKHEEAKQGFVLLPRRWVVERSFAWMSRLRRLARDYQQIA